MADHDYRTQTRHHYKSRRRVGGTAERDLRRTDSHLPGPVSYTHLDVYKRQVHQHIFAGADVVSIAVDKVIVVEHFQVGDGDVFGIVQVEGPAGGILDGDALQGDAVRLLAVFSKGIKNALPVIVPARRLLPCLL